MTSFQCPLLPEFHPDKRVKIGLDEAVRIIREIGHLRNVSIYFIKRDNTPRSMTIRHGIKSGITGKGMNYTPDIRNLLVVWDVEAQTHKTIPLEGLRMLQADGVVYEVLP